jgi:hypothetical protein
MRFDDFVRNIDFRFCKPDIRPGRFYRLSRLLNKINIPLEIINTLLPADESLIKQRLAPVCKIPKMSTFAIGAIINRAVSSMEIDTCFVNIGVWNGFTFIGGIAGNPEKECIGVDNFSQFDGPREKFLERFEEYKSSNHFFFDMDYIDYFSNIHTRPIGFYIYDGDHSYENQLKGLQKAEPFFSKDCIIMVDDTNWKEPREATMDFIKQSKNKYKILLDITTFSDQHPTYWDGIILFRRLE